MTGLYNVLFGENASQKQFLFGLLNLKPEDTGRYRDIYVVDGHIVIHTRNGGGNREYYEDVFEALSQHPLYDYDEDNSFDCTYADIYFKWPPGYEELLAVMAEGTVTPSERWKLFFEAVNTRG